MKVIYELSENNIQQLHALYQQQWWSCGRTLEESKSGVLGSQICIGIVTHSDELIGFSRVLTDFTFKALILDVIVEQSHWGKGLGNLLMTQVKTHPRLLKVKHFELYCVPEMVAFYQNQGFSSDVGEIKLMRLTTS